MAAGVFFFPFEVAPDLEQWIITAVKNGVWGNSKLQRVVKTAMIGFFGNDADIGERIHIALFFHVIETVDVQVMVHIVFVVYSSPAHFEQAVFDIFGSVLADGHNAAVLFSVTFGKQFEVARTHGFIKRFTGAAHFRHHQMDEVIVIEVLNAVGRKLDLSQLLAETGGAVQKIRVVGEFLPGVRGKKVVMFGTVAGGARKTAAGIYSFVIVGDGLGVYWSCLPFGVVKRSGGNEKVGIKVKAAD